MTDSKIVNIVQFLYYCLIIELFLSMIGYNSGKLIPGRIIFPVIALTFIILIGFFCFYYFRKGYNDK